jgi:hypothetical protein
MIDNPTQPPRKEDLPFVSLSILSQTGLSSKVATKKREEIKPMTNQEFTEFPQEVQTALQAGRINIYQANVVQLMFKHFGKESCLRTLADTERLNYLKPYFEYSETGFTMQGFSYSRQQTPHAEKQKIGAALQKALTILEIDLSEDDGATKEDPPCG